MSACQVLLNPDRNPVLIVALGHLICRLQNLRAGISHGNACAGLPDHGDIVGTVPEGRAFPAVKVQIFAEEF